MAANPKRELLRDKKYINSFKVPGNHFCMLTGAESPDAAHVRKGWLAAGQKPPDNRIIPLAHHLHQKQHVIGELQFWLNHIDQIPEDLKMEAIEHCKSELGISRGHIDILDIVIRVAINYYNQYRRS